MVMRLGPKHGLNCQDIEEVQIGQPSMDRRRDSVRENSELQEKRKEEKTAMAGA